MTYQFDVIAGRPSAAFPGTLTRTNLPHEVISAEPLSTSTVYFGNPVVRDSSTGLIRSFGASDTVAFGFAVKAFPTTQAQWPPAGFTFPEQASTTQTMSILREGYIQVQILGAAAPVQGGVVYAQIVADTGIPVGSLTAVAEGSAGAHSVVLAGATWASTGVDSNGFGEIRFRAA